MSGLRGRVGDTIAAVTGDGREWALLAVATGWLFVLGTRVIFPALLPYVQTAFSLSSAMAGLLVTVLWGAYALTQFPGGLLSDVVGERATLAVSALITASGAVALALGANLAIFVLGVVLFGLGSGFYAPPRVTVLSRIYPERDSTALGLTFATGNVGAAMLPPIAGALAVLVGWRYGFVFVAPPLVVAAIGLWLWVPPHEGSDRSIESPRRTTVRLVETFRNRLVLRTWVAMTLALLAYQGVTAFLPTYLIRAKGLAPVTATTLYGLLFASGALAQVLVGPIADRYGAPQVSAAIAAFSTVAIGLLAFVTGLLPLGVLVVLVGIRLGLGPIGNGYAAGILPTDVQGSGFGLFRTFYLVVGSLASSIVGAMAGLGLFDEAFLFLGALMGLSALAFQGLPAIGDVADLPETSDSGDAKSGAGGVDGTDD